MAAGFLGGLLGGGGGDDFDIYGDLLTDKQKAALRSREMTQGLLRMSGAFAEAAKPSLLPTGGIGAALGKGAAALAGSEDEGLKSLATIQKMKQTRQQMEWADRIKPIVWRELSGATVIAPANQPPSPGAQPAAPVPTTGPGVSPRALGTFDPSTLAPPSQGVPGAFGSAGEYGAQQDLPSLPPAAPPAAPPGTQTTGLLSPPPGPPDQVIPSPSPFGGPLAMPASYAGGGGMPGGDPNNSALAALAQTIGPTPGREDLYRTAALGGGPPPPFRRAAASPGAAGAAVPGGADPRGLIPYIRQQAIARGIDPDVAVQVAMSEGLGNPVGDSGKSHGAFQLYTGGGMGNDFQRATGLDPSDPRNEKSTIDYALDNVTRAGWTPWKGAAKVGVGPRTGLPGDVANYAGASLRGEKPADIVLPSGSGGGQQLEALQALMQLTRPPGGDDDLGGGDILASLRPAVGGGGAPALSPAALAHLNYGQTGALGDPSKPGWTKENLTTVPAPGGARFQVHKNAAADFQGFLKELGDMGYKIDPKASGGYNYRKITGGNALSEHAYGTAIDVNWNDNLYSKDGRKVTNLPPEVGEVAARYNLEWGGNWKDPVDTMHFQWRPPGAGGQDTVISSGRGLPASALQRAQYNPLAGAANQPAGAAGTAAAPGGGTIPGSTMTPRQMGALGAAMELAGMDSGPIRMLLDSYYKSPDYLAGAAGAETRARLGVEKELKPGIEADILRATMDPKIQLKEKEELINRKSKEIEQDRELYNKLQLDFAKDGMTMLKMPDGTTKIVPLPEAARIREEGAARLEAAREGEKLVDVTVTLPGETQSREMKMPTKTYRDIFSGKGAPELGIPPMSGIKLGKPVYNPTETALGPIEAKAIFDSHQLASDAATTIDTNKQARALLDAGVITGFGADKVTALTKLGNALGVTGRDSREMVANTESYLSTTAANVGRMIKQFGAGTGLSDADREYAAQMAAGKITLDETSIRKILDINDRASLNIINRHNQRVSKIAPGATMTDLNVPVPTPYQAPEKPAATTAPATGAPIDKATFDALPSGSVFIAPDGSRRVKP